MAAADSSGVVVVEGERDGFDELIEWNDSVAFRAAVGSVWKWCSGRETMDETESLWNRAGTSSERPCAAPTSVPSTDARVETAAGPSWEGGRRTPLVPAVAEAADWNASAMASAALERGGVVRAATDSPAPARSPRAFPAAINWALSSSPAVASAPAEGPRGGREVCSARSGAGAGGPSAPEDSVAIGCVAGGGRKRTGRSPMGVRERRPRASTDERAEDRPSSWVAVDAGRSGDGCGLRAVTRSNGVVLGPALEPPDATGARGGKPRTDPPTITLPGWLGAATDEDADDEDVDEDDTDEDDTDEVAVEAGPVDEGAGAAGISDVTSGEGCLTLVWEPEGSPMEGLGFGFEALGETGRFVVIDAPRDARAGAGVEAVAATEVDAVTVFGVESTTGFVAWAVVTIGAGATATFGGPGAGRPASVPKGPSRVTAGAGPRRESSILKARARSPVFRTNVAPRCERDRASSGRPQRSAGRHGAPREDAPVPVGVGGGRGGAEAPGPPPTAKAVDDQAAAVAAAATVDAVPLPAPNAAVGGGCGSDGGESLDGMRVVAVVPAVPVVAWEASEMVDRVGDGSVSELVSVPSGDVPLVRWGPLRAASAASAASAAQRACRSRFRSASTRWTRWTTRWSSSSPRGCVAGVPRRAASRSQPW